MKKAYIAFVFNKAEKKDYSKTLTEYLKKEGIDPQINYYESNLEVEMDSWILRPGVVFSTWPELKDILPEEAHQFVYYFYVPPVRNIAAKVHMELLWGGVVRPIKGTVVISIPIIENQKWMEEAVLHEWVHACHLIKIRNFLPTQDTMDSYSGILDGLEENMKQIRPHFDLIFQKPKAITLAETTIGLLRTMIELLGRLISLKTQPQPIAPDPVPDGKYYALHHSGTLRDWTRAETIIGNHKELYGGKCYYNLLIDKDGVILKPESFKKDRGTTDICVIGNFVVEEPTTKQIESLKGIIAGQKWTTHSELAKQGKATPSLCPGNLTNYL